MSNYNKVILMGNLTRDPETRVTPAGLTICKLGLAVNRVWNDRDGQKREETTFIDVDAFGKQAETISKFLSKGSPLFVEGRLKLDQWESEGQKRSKLSVVLEQFQFIGSRGDISHSSERSEEPPAQRRSPPKQHPPADEDEDVPF